MTKDVDKSNWNNNFSNKSLSGIEVRDINGKLVNFITIKHDDILENKAPHRITINLNEFAEPLLPPPQTFEEIIQAKRRQQVLLYGPGSSNANLTERTARRVTATARQVAAAAGLSRRALPNSGVPSRSTKRSRSSGRSRKRPRKKSSPPKSATAALIDNPPPPLLPPPPPPPPPSSSYPPPSLVEKVLEPSDINFSSSEIITPPKPAQTARKSASTALKSPLIVSPEASKIPVREPKPGPSKMYLSPHPVVVPMKDLNKGTSRQLFGSMDPKDVKMIMKHAAPGSSIVLPDGTVIRKSRRGGARVGAGRKRSRPMDLGATGDTPFHDTSSSHPPPPSSNTSSSFSSQA